MGQTSETAGAALSLALLFGLMFVRRRA